MFDNTSDRLSYVHKATRPIAKSFYTHTNTSVASKVEVAKAENLRQSAIRMEVKISIMNNLNIKYE